MMTALVLVHYQGLTNQEAAARSKIQQTLGPWGLHGAAGGRLAGIPGRTKKKGPRRTRPKFREETLKKSYDDRGGR